MIDTLLGHFRFVGGYQDMLVHPCPLRKRRQPIVTICPIWGNSSRPPAGSRPYRADSAAALAQHEAALAVLAARAVGRGLGRAADRGSRHRQVPDRAGARLRPAHRSTRRASSTASPPSRSKEWRADARRPYSFTTRPRLECARGAHSPRVHERPMPQPSQGSNPRLSSFRSAPAQWNEKDKQRDDPQYRQNPVQEVHGDLNRWHGVPPQMRRHQLAGDPRAQVKCGTSTAILDLE
jgi:hypothetical protein